MTLFALATMVAGDSVNMEAPCRSPRASWLVTTPLALLMAFPAQALEPVHSPRPPANSPLLAQSQQAHGEIPAEVQGWFDGAKAANAKGEAAEALRLQMQVLAWLGTNPRAPVVFRARAS
jgi:hypothetical protein